jgi:hypothetical protein
MKYLFNRKLFELFDKKVRNYSLFDKFLNPSLNPSLMPTVRTVLKKPSGLLEEEISEQPLFFRNTT